MVSIDSLILTNYLDKYLGHSIIFDATVFFAGCLILVWSANLLVSSLVKMASHMRLSKYTIAFILMGLTTTIPEFFVGVTSALNGVPIFSLGNVLGSNIADLGLALGIGAIVAKNINFKSRVNKKDSLYMLISASLPLVLLADGQISRPDGIVLIGVFFFYMINLIYSQRNETEVKYERLKRGQFFTHIFIFLIGILLLLLSAQTLVKSGESISIALNLPLILIGLFVTAVGTSLPEIAFVLKSVQNHFGEMAVGDVIGSVVVNSTFILGVTALIHPITLVSSSIVILSAVFMLIILTLFLIFSRLKESLDWIEGIILLFVYILFVIFGMGAGTLG